MQARVPVLHPDDHIDHVTGVVVRCCDILWASDELRIQDMHRVNEFYSTSPCYLVWQASLAEGLGAPVAFAGFHSNHKLSGANLNLVLSVHARASANTSPAHCYMAILTRH